MGYAFQRSAIDPKFFSQISFDCGGIEDSRPTLATAPEAASTIETATHGFSIVTAADGQRAVQFIKTRDDGTKVTFQLCEGARGTPYSDLAQYGNEKLQGATLGTHSEFEEMVDELFKAVKGLKVAIVIKLQTEDEALKLAFKIVQEGVLREGGGSWVEFDTEDKDGFDTEDKDGGWAVSGCRVRDGVSIWRDCVSGGICAFFDVSSPESK